MADTTTTMPGLGLSPGAHARPVAPPRSSRQGPGIGEVRLDEGFWGTLQKTNGDATLEHCVEWMERLGWIENFDRVARGTTTSPRPGWQFSDSEVYKLLEALAWEFARTRSPAVDAMFEKLVDRIAPAQDPDGYLNTCYGHPGQDARYSDMSGGHELYCAGHLLQAAVARMRTVGEDRLVALARRVADHVCAEFGVSGAQQICGHPEIEVALVEFGRATGDARYTDQARLFLARRGHGILKPMPLLGPAYFQDETPILATEAWHGHAVRALYLAAGAADLAVDTDDSELLHALERQWSRTVERRTYLTGGMGSRHQDEGFGDDWELPQDRAYCETCAGIASVMVSWRLLLATGDVRYADLMERTFYNVIATSPSPDGRAFFYSNPLQQRVPGTEVRPDAENPRAEGGVRAPWFDVSCCPTNLARTLASWHTYSAMTEGTTATLLQYAAGTYNLHLGDGGTLRLTVRTAYPYDGAITIEVLEASTPGTDLRLRVPSWAAGAVLTSAGETKRAHPGWATVAGVEAGDTIRLVLPISPRLTWPDPRIDAVRGSVAVERGPLVLCLESLDLPADVSIDDLRLDIITPADVEGDGASCLVSAFTPTSAKTEGLPFGERTAFEPSEPITVPLIPYHRWARRGPSTMRVFIPVAMTRTSVRKPEARTIMS